MMALKYICFRTSELYKKLPSLPEVKPTRELNYISKNARMDQIQHKYVNIRGLKLHIAEIGTGEKVVVFLHGFPEIWYTWRYQMVAVAKAGYRVIAPDSRGYGLSEIPSEPEKTTFQDLVDDLFATLNSFAIQKVFLVGQDFGALSAYHFTLSHPDMVTGVVTIGIPLTAPGSSFTYYDELPEGYYVQRWQKPGRAEADFGRLEVKNVIRNIYILFSRSEIPIAGENEEIMDLVDHTVPLPPWFTEDDLTNYATLYETSGFRTPLTVPYRQLQEDCRETNPEVSVPALLIVGKKDYTFKFPGMEKYITSGEVKKYVPNLETIYLPEGSHFAAEQFPDEVNEIITTFLSEHA